MTSKGSNVTLTCLARKVDKLDTVVSWIFDDQEIKESSNKKAIGKFLPRRRGNFSLRITNVSMDDVGKYTCAAYVANFGKADVVKNFIDLKVFETGE